MKNLNKLLIILIPVIFMASGVIAQEVLYDNGPFVTAVGVGSNGSDYSEVQVDLGLGATGQAVNINGPTEIALADDFVVDGTWTISSFTFFAYQTGAGPPSTIIDVKVQIWDGNPMEGGSVIWGDISLATGPNLLVSTEWTNCWRVKTPYAETRPIMNVVANTAGLILESGTYWVQWTCAGSASSGPWAPYISILGQAETGNSIQKQSGWNPNMDGGFPQGIPFIIEGTSGSLPDNDLSVVSIMEPATGMGLGEEPVSVRVLNMGTATQTGFDVSYTINNGATVTETVSATIASFESYDYTFNTTADLSEIGTYNIEACVILTGDEVPDNDCKEKEVENFPVDFCDASTGSEDEWISRVVCGAIDNSSEWQNGIADYTEFYTSIGAGMSEEITIYNGTPYASDMATVWVDWNDDFVFESGSNEEFVLTNNGTGTLFTSEILVPDDAADGMHRMRVRLVYNETPNPCGFSSYGEVEDYNILVADPTYGNLEGTVSANGGDAIEGATVLVDDVTYTTGADGTYAFTNLSTGTKTVTCIADGYYEASEIVLVEEGLTATLDFELSSISYGTLEGNVTDGSTPIEGATVTVEIGSGNTITATSGADGMYSITNIEVGSYDVSCVATGYSFEYETNVLIEGGISTTVDFVLEETGIIPQNFTAEVVDVTDILLEWESPAGALMELSQNDGEAVNIYANYYLETGYGVVYDLSDYPGATLELLDFYNYTGGATGPWDYKVHIVDWETHTELTVLGPFQTTVSDDWEQNIYLGSYSAGISGVIAVLIEPMGNSGGEVYPQIPIDNSLNGSSVFGPLSEYTSFAPAGADFLIDLWVISPNGKEKLKAEKVSVGNSPSEKASETFVSIENNGLSFNKKGNESKDFIGYNVYRGDELIAENLTITHFLDEDLLAGTYTYDVKAVYDEGLSEGAGPLTVTIGSGVPRDLVIVEVGTGTWCSFCPGAAMGVDQMHEEGLSVGIIEYHSADAYSTTEGGLRLNYYNVSSFPTAIFDGVDYQSGGSATNSLYDSYLPRYESRLEVPSLFTLNATYENIEGENYQITAGAEMIETYPGLTHDIVLQVALIESHIEQNWQNQTELNFVCRDMIPDQDGTILDFAANSTQSVSLDFTIPSEYDMENVDIIVLLQDYTTKEVLQGTSAMLSTGIETNAKEMGVSVYPNPFKNYTNVLFTLQEEEDVAITVYSIIGDVVFHSEQTMSAGMQDFHINTQEFNSGVYIINLVAGDNVYTKKISSY